MNKRLATILLFTLISFSAFSQKKPFLQSFDLGVDYLKFASFAYPEERKYEGIAALNFGFGLSIDGEYGYTKKSPHNFYKNGKYEFEGTYYRIGLGYNSPLGENTTIGIGARFAESTFSDRTSFTIKSTMFNDFHLEESRENLYARWVEILLRSESSLKTVKNVKLGMFLRVKFLDPVRQQDDLILIQAVPGYGLTKNVITPAFNLFIKYSIPLNL